MDHLNRNTPKLEDNTEMVHIPAKEVTTAKNASNDEIGEEYKQCAKCNEIKLKIDFYRTATKKTTNKCKKCWSIYSRAKVEEKLEMNGGSEHYYKEPNRWKSETQRNQVFQFLQLLDWVFDESTGIWNKKGFKEDGVFINITPTPKRFRRPSSGGGRKIKSGVWNNVDKIIKFIEQGYTYNDLSEIFDASHTTIRAAVTKYRDDKRSN